MKVFIKGLNTCVMRKQKLTQYMQYLIDNNHQLVDSPEKSDSILVWTCAFRSDVRDNSLDQLELYEKTYDSNIIAAGCMPDISPDILESRFHGELLPWKDDSAGMERLFDGNPDKPLDKTVPIFTQEAYCHDAELFRKENPGKDASFHDQFIKLVVSEGCLYQCAYCSERLAFPPYHSFDLEGLATSCAHLVKKTGRKEVILLADSLGQYGRDIGINLVDLLRRLKKVDSNLVFALNNLHCNDVIQFFDELFAMVQNGDICHLNLPIQSGSPQVLKRMNRSYELGDIQRVFEKLNELDFREFDTHIIIGFPGETEDDFKQTLDFILRYRPKYVLASKYMDSLDAPAHNLSNKVEDEVAFKRIREFETQMIKAGILYNSELGELMRNRLERVNARNEI
ncbi:MAG: radical SAM protein [Magnetococcales bacterium]|nr:radical SAM protein [Magnetococcales bacterium]